MCVCEPSLHIETLTYFFGGPVPWLVLEVLGIALVSSGRVSLVLGSCALGISPFSGASPTAHRSAPKFD